MRKLLTLTLGMLLLANTCYADTCPSVADIKNNHFTGWTAYDSDEGKPLTPERLTQITKAIDQFALAEWKTTGPKVGSIHCYYRDKHGSDFEAYFAKENLALNEKNKLWYEVTGSMHCAAGMDKCSFDNSMSNNNALAKNKSVSDETPAT